VVDIKADSRAHFHKRMTEIYLVMEGEGEIELDGTRYPVKPMTAEEAALRLSGESDQFLVFRDADTSRLSVLYKRKDGNYGLIAP